MTPPHTELEGKGTQAVILLSGGMDSTVLAYKLHKEAVALHAVLFHYGQKHYRELDYARKTCDRLGIPFTQVELAGMFGKSSLVGDESGGIVVPNRNLVFLSVGAAIAISKGRDRVAIACNLDDRALFPDCRSEFLTQAAEAIRLGCGVEIVAPFVNTSKRHIVKLGRELDVPFAETWSCYIGGSKPCGKCHACETRRDALYSEALFAHQNLASYPEPWVRGEDLVNPAEL